MKTSLSLSDIKYVPFIRENWRNNYLNWLLRNLDSTIANVKKQILSLIEGYPDGLLKCDFSFKLDGDKISPYGEVCNFSAIENTFGEKIDTLISALLLIYGEDRLGNLFRIPSECESISLRRVCEELDLEYLGDICIISTADLERKIVEHAKQKGLLNLEEERLNEIIFQIQNALSEYNLTLGMAIPSWDKFRPRGVIPSP